MKKIGIIGGSFDPIHFGHIGLAQDAYDQVNLDGVIFLPAYIQPFKMDNKPTSAYHRVNIIKLAIKNKKHFSVSTFELEKQGVSYTYETLKALKEKELSDAKVYFISGTDAFLSMPKWKEGRNLLLENNFIVGVRPGYREDELKAAIERARNISDAEILLIDNNRLDISATEIRERISKNQDVSELIPDDVRDYIVKNKIYVG